MKLEVVPLAIVNLQDRTFFIGQEGDIGLLKDSIEGIGLINPPILRRVGEKYQIICGRKRLKACKELGLREVFSRTY